MTSDARSTHIFSHFNCRLIFVYKLNHEFINIEQTNKHRRKGKILARPQRFVKKPEPRPKLTVTEKSMVLPLQVLC